MGVRIVLMLMAAGVLGWYAFQRGRKGAWMSVVISIAVAAVCIYAGLGLVLFVMQPRFVFWPHRQLVVGPERLWPGTEEVTILAADGVSLNAWYVPAEGEAAYTVLFCHGNAGNISHRVESLMHFRDLGLHCLIFDYRGYGKSEGRPTEAGMYADALAAWQWLRREKGAGPEQILIFGRSIGGVVAAHIASEVTGRGERPAGLVLESTFSTFVDMGRHYYPYMPVRWFARFRFDTVEALEAVDCPVLVIHSRQDEIAPFRLGQRVFEAAREPKRFEEIRGSHNEGFSEDAANYRQVWQRWLGDLEAGRLAETP